MKKLLLFDIDGTMLRVRGAARQAMEQALARLFGRSVHTDGVSFAGRTDPQIFHDVLLRNGCSASDAAARLPEAMACYVETARRLIQPRHVEVLPGVRALIEALAAAPQVQLALLTGNLEATAYLKLDAAGLAGFFPFGAFGSDHADRAQLPPVAVRRAHAFAGHAYAGKDVVIIGDTQHDILCGRGIGAYAVGVCTGHFSRAELTPHAPDLLLDDLRDADFFLRRVVLGAG